MQRRSSFNIAIDILNICRTPCGPTRIVYGVNLNFKLLQDYAETLSAEGLLRKEGGKWQTTEKGLTLLGRAREITLIAPCLCP